MWKNQYIQVRGRVTADPELKDASSGKRYTRIGIACNHKAKDKEGKEVELATFYNALLFDKMAEIYSKVKKGDMVYVEGDLQQRPYVSKKGDAKVENTVMVDVMHKVAWVGEGEDN